MKSGEWMEVHIVPSLPRAPEAVQSRARIWQEWHTIWQHVKCWLKKTVFLQSKLHWVIFCFLVTRFKGCFRLPCPCGPRTQRKETKKNAAHAVLLSCDIQTYPWKTQRFRSEPHHGGLKPIRERSWKQNVKESPVPICHHDWIMTASWWNIAKIGSVWYTARTPWLHGFAMHSNLTPWWSRCSMRQSRLPVNAEISTKATCKKVVVFLGIEMKIVTCWLLQYKGHKGPERRPLFPLKLNSGTRNVGLKA